MALLSFLMYIVLYYLVTPKIWEGLYSVIGVRSMAWATGEPKVWDSRHKREQLFSKYGTFK